MFEMGHSVEVTIPYTADWEYVPKGTQGEVIQYQDGEVLVKLDLFDHPIWIPEGNLTNIQART